MNTDCIRICFSDNHCPWQEQQNEMNGVKEQIFASNGFVGQGKKQTMFIFQLKSGVGGVLLLDFSSVSFDFLSFSEPVARDQCGY